MIVEVSLESNHNHVGIRRWVFDGFLAGSLSSPFSPLPFSTPTTNHPPTKLSHNRLHIMAGAVQPVPEIVVSSSPVDPSCTPGRRRSRAPILILSSSPSPLFPPVHGPGRNQQAGRASIKHSAYPSRQSGCQDRQQARTGRGKEDGRRRGRLECKIALFVYCSIWSLSQFAFAPGRYVQEEGFKASGILKASLRAICLPLPLLTSHVFLACANFASLLLSLSRTFVPLASISIPLGVVGFLLQDV